MKIFSNKARNIVMFFPRRIKNYILGGILGKIKKQNAQIQHLEHQILKLISTLARSRDEESPSREQRYIISLILHRDQLPSLAPYTIITLLNQSIKPDKVVLWVAKEDSKKITTTLYEKLSENGLEILFCDNMGFAPILDTFPNDFVILITDYENKVFYPKNWTEQFFLEGGYPPHTIPVEMKSDFTMHGKIPVLYQYIDERINNPLKVTKQIYDNVFQQLDSKQFSYYGDDVYSFYDAFIDYPFENKTVLIFGLAGCNCEAMALWNNAKKVYVVDYNKPICEHERIEVLTHLELLESDLRFDIGISFSSFEHDGLGRYGDPIAPDGDLKAVQYAKALIKEDGLLFLGVPLGKDCLVWNAHRIYGPIRFPVLIRNWFPLDVYHIESVEIFEKPVGCSGGQPLVVLKNSHEIKELDFHNRIKYAEKLLKDDKTSTRDGALLKCILEMQMLEFQ